MREVGASALWALIIGAPLSLLGGLLSSWLAHSDTMKPVAMVLFAPFFLFSVAEKNMFPGALSETASMFFALAAQFIGYFLVVAAVRAIRRRSRNKEI